VGHALLGRRDPGADLQPETGKVIGINALGVAPTGATPEFFHKKGMNYPPEFGPLAAVTPGTPGGLMTMLAEYGSMSLAEVLAPAIQMADGYPMEAELSNTIEHYKKIAQWPYSKRTILIHPARRARVRSPARSSANRSRRDLAQNWWKRSTKPVQPARTARRRIRRV